MTDPDTGTENEDPTATVVGSSPVLGERVRRQGHDGWGSVLEVGRTDLPPHALVAWDDGRTYKVPVSSLTTEEVPTLESTLVLILNSLTYEQCVEVWNEADEFQSNITDHWAGEAEAHMERLAEEGRYGR